MAGDGRRPRHFSIGELGRLGGLSRSALLYYDRVGLLRPGGRTSSNYRRYSEADLERLRRICTFREVGLPLKDIALILDGSGRGGDGFTAALERRLESLNAEMRRLNVQRRAIAGMLAREDSGDKPAFGAAFLEALHSVGMSEEDQDALHAEFERLAPEDHERFLRFIGLDDSAIRAVRSKAAARPSRQKNS